MHLYYFFFKIIKKPTYYVCNLVLLLFICVYVLFLYYYSSSSFTFALPATVVLCPADSFQREQPWPEQPENQTGQNIFTGHINKHRRKLNSWSGRPEGG